MTSSGPPIVVTVSARYGAGGSRIGPKAAEALGVPFLDRAIPTEVAERLSQPLEEALAQDEQLPSRLDRILAPFARVGLALGGAPPVPELDDRTVADATREVICELAEGGGVVLGRAGAVVLADRPGALHVRLAGPEEARVRQGMAIEAVDEDTARRHLAETDRAREAYVRHFYGRDPADPDLYHLVLDSTAIDLEVCVDVIVRAARSVAAQAPRRG